MPGIFSRGLLGQREAARGLFLDVEIKDILGLFVFLQPESYNFGASGLDIAILRAERAFSRLVAASDRNFDLRLTSRRN